MQRCQENIFILEKVSFFSMKISKMWMIHSDIQEKFVILQIKKYQADILEQDIELCPFSYFPVATAGKEDANLICKFLLGFHTSIAFAYLFLLIPKKRVHEQSDTYVEGKRHSMTCQW
jgi:hypothetical protein